MKPGHALDALVAERVLKLRASEAIGMWSFPDRPPTLIWEPYSTDIRAAWEVLEKTNLLAYNQLFVGSDGKWRVANYESYLYQPDRYEGCDTAAHAICRAALKAKP